MSDTNVHRVVGNLLVGTSHFFVDTTTNQVGINTSSPSASLDVATGDVKVGSGITLANNGTITATGFSGDGSGLENVAGDSGSWVNGTNSNVHLATSTNKVGIGTHSPGAELHVAGTGAIIVPVGTTGERPGTAVNGMIRYNNTIGNIEVYTAGVWSPLTQPPTITGISPLTTLITGGQAAGFFHQAELVHPTPATSDYFGTFISLTSDGTRAIVGCWGDDEQGGSLDEVGSAHVYKRTGTTWTHEDELLDPSPTSNSPSKFGYAVEISEDGLYAFVGAPKDKVDPSSGAQRGSVHVFVRSGTTWSYQREMNEPVPDNGSEFGHRVSTNSDGSRVLISAPGAVVGSVDNVGAMYVFTRSGTTWTLEATLDESMVGGFSGGVEQYENFGDAISLSSDGAYAITGVKGDEKTGGADASGVAHIFYRSGTSWTHQKSLSQDGVSADATAAQYNTFGCSVDITSDGSRVVIGAQNTLDYGKPEAGAAYIFVRSGTTWTFERYLEHPAPGQGDRFGATVRIAANGDRVVVGAPWDDTTGGSDMGSAHIFDRSGTTWTVTTGQTGLLQPGASASTFMMTGEETHGQLAISADGAYVTLGVPRDDIFAGPPLASQGTVQIFNMSPSQNNTSTEIFTVTGTGITLGSTVKLVGADGTLYDVFDVTTTPTGTQVTFKMGALGTSGGFVVANQPYKVRIESAAGLNVISTAQIGFSPTWTTAALTDLSFTVGVSGSQTIEGTDGGGLTTNRTFSVQSGNLPANLGLNQNTGVIQGTITTSGEGSTPVVFRLEDTNTSLFVDRTFNIVGIADLYPFTTHIFHPCGKSGRVGPTITDCLGNYGNVSPWNDSNFFNITGDGIQEWVVPSTATYTIEANGAGLYSFNQGGYGARIRADNVPLTKGETIKILCGQLPSGVTNNNANHGGGGGTFVVRTPYNTNASIIVIAGGAGGAHNYGYQSRSNGQLGTSGETGTGGGAGGSGGYAGSNGHGSAGAGFLGGASNASSFISGGRGGVSGIYEAGFGGGGEHGNTHGGGGGGYSGGGGSSGHPYCGGGGGSYTANITVGASDNTVWNQRGQVTITMN